MLRYPYHLTNWLGRRSWSVTERRSCPSKHDCIVEDEDKGQDESEDEGHGENEHNGEAEGEGEDEDGAISDSSQAGEIYTILNDHKDEAPLKEVRLSHPLVKRDLDSFSRMLRMLSSERRWPHLDHELADMDIGRLTCGPVSFSQLKSYGNLTIRVPPDA